MTTAAGTCAETIVTMYLFGVLWSKWELAFKVTTPMLHLAFSAAQVHGSMVFYRMYKRQERHLDEKPDEKPDVENLRRMGPESSNSENSLIETRFVPYGHLEAPNA